MPWLLSPCTNILVRHGSLDGILQGFWETANPEPWFSSQQKGNQPKIASDTKGIPRQLSSALSQERPEHKSAQRGEGRSEGWCCLDWRCCFPLISLLIIICHWSQIRSQSVCSYAVFCVNWSRKKRIPELQKKLCSLIFWQIPKLPSFLQQFLHFQSF